MLLAERTVVLYCIQITQCYSARAEYRTQDVGHEFKVRTLPIVDFVWHDKDNDDTAKLHGFKNYKLLKHSEVTRSKKMC